ncbi:MAG: cytochrome c [Steroidobacteraceae bacterium]
MTDSRSDLFRRSRARRAPLAIAPAVAARDPRAAFQRLRPALRLLLAIAVLGAALLAAGCGNKPKVAVDPEIEEKVRVRKQNFSEIGTLFKNLGDTVKKGQPLQGNPAVQSSVQQLASYAKDEKFWFDEGTGPESGADTDAKAEIWTNRADFDQKVEALIAETDKLQQVYAAGGDPAFAEQLKAVGVACQNCHKKYRTEDND